MSVTKFNAFEEEKHTIEANNDEEHGSASKTKYVDVNPAPSPLPVAADHVKFQGVDMTANPAPLGLFAFGMTTMLLCLHFCHLYPISSMHYGMVMFYGGIMQVIVGIMEWMKKNTFGTLAFSSYGCFWLSLFGEWAADDLGLTTASPADHVAMYFFLWGMFSLLVFFATLKMNRVIQFVFGAVTVTFWFLALKDLLQGKGKEDAAEVFEYMTGVCGCITAAAAMYLGIAQVYNEVYKREVLPIFPIPQD